MVRDRGWQPYEPANPVLWLRAGPVAKRLALGFDNLVADVYWMRAVVYYGGKRLASRPGRTTTCSIRCSTWSTTLDPQFKVAYRFGAIFLTEAYPAGPGAPTWPWRSCSAGMAANPNAWEYMQDIGFVYYWWLQDYPTAAELVRQGEPIRRARRTG